MSQENYLLNAACWSNGYSLCSVNEKATGFKTSTIASKQLSSHETDTAETFIVSSRIVKNDRERETSIMGFLNDPGLKLVSLIDDEDLQDAKTLPLGNDVPLTMEVGEAIVKRRSIRHYTGDPLSFDYLTTLIHAAQGVSAINHVPLKRGNDKVKLSLRTAPSGGGLYPVKLYVAILKGKKMERALYRYAPQKDLLVQVGNQEIVDALMNTYSAPSDIISTKQASALFLLIGMPWRSMRKYGPRGLRFVFQEAGAIAQNLHLTTTALGLGSVDCSSFYDDDVHQVLGMDGVNQFFIHAIFLGSL